jgi:preprotein translocase subunit SecG
MEIVVSVFIIIVSVVLVLVVLVQNSKGGGLAANFSSSNQIMGVRKTTDFIEKLTWGLAIFLLVLCLASSALIERGGVSGADTQIKEQIEATPETLELPNTEGLQLENTDKKEAPAEKK